MGMFIQKLPKAELHLHIEGTIEPETMFRIAKRNNISLPYKSADEIRRAYNFENLQSFLDIYYKGAEVLIHERDFYEITWEYLIKVAKENVRHVEIFFDPQSHTSRGISFSTVISGISKALKKAETELGISFHIIMCFLKHLSEEDAIETFKLALPYKDQIFGVGLDSTEMGNPPMKFENVLDMALKEGFIAVSHAGEEGPAENIWESIKRLNVRRIDHGVKCDEDPELLEYLRRSQIPLTVCPLSNVKLCVFKDMKDHNIKKLLDLGLCVTVNSDDPAYFGGYLNQNYIELQKALNLTEKELAQLAKNSFEASFISIERKQFNFNEIDLLYKSFKD